MKYDRKFMERLINEADEAEAQGNINAFHEFGKECAATYIPALLDELDVLHGVSLPTGAPDFDAKTCESCYWRHQSARIGCSFCNDFSEFIELFSPLAAKRHRELLDKARTKK